MPVIRARKAQTRELRVVRQTGSADNDLSGCTGPSFQRSIPSAKGESLGRLTNGILRRRNGGRLVRKLLLLQFLVVLRGVAHVAESALVFPAVFVRFAHRTRTSFGSLVAAFGQVCLHGKFTISVLALVPGPGRCIRCHRCACNRRTRFSAVSTSWPFPGR